MFRNMTSIYLFREDKVLLLNRVGSRVFVEPTWVGIGGHMEENEINDPERCVLRELWEETGISKEELSGISLRYVTLRRTETEIRQNHYFFAALERPGWDCPQSNEGELQWLRFEEALEKKMPASAHTALKHYLEKGRYDEEIYLGVTTVRDGAFAVDFAPLLRG